MFEILHAVGLGLLLLIFFGALFYLLYLLGTISSGKYK